MSSDLGPTVPPGALTRLVDRRAMMPSVIEMRVVKCAKMRTAVCTKGAN